MSFQQVLLLHSLRSKQEGKTCPLWSCAMTSSTGTNVKGPVHQWLTGLFVTASVTQMHSAKSFTLVGDKALPQDWGACVCVNTLKWHSHRQMSLVLLYNTIKKDHVLLWQVDVLLTQPKECSCLHSCLLNHPEMFVWRLPQRQDSEVWLRLISCKIFGSGQPGKIQVYSKSSQLIHTLVSSDNSAVQHLNTWTSHEKKRSDESNHPWFGWLFRATLFNFHAIAL